MTREEQWHAITDMTGRLSAAERELSMVRPRMRQMESSILDTNDRTSRLEWHMDDVLDRLSTVEQTGHSMATDMRAYQQRRLGDVWRQYKEDIGYVVIIILLLSANGAAVPSWVRDILKGVSAGGLLGG